MSKLKIAFLSYRSDPFSGGQGIYLRNLCEALIQRNHEITIFSGNPLPNVPEQIRLIEVETPGYFETFSFRERVQIFKKISKSRMDYLDFFETCTGTFTEPIFFLKIMEFQIMYGKIMLEMVLMVVKKERYKFFLGGN